MISEKLDPVRCLYPYINRTNIFRESKSDPVFLSLTKPYQKLSSSSIANILNEAIVSAGLGNRGYRAKCFRPTSATRAVNSDCDPDRAMSVGRWNTRSVFF